MDTTTQKKTRGNELSDAIFELGQEANPSIKETIHLLGKLSAILHSDQRCLLLLEQEVLLHKVLLRGDPGNVENKPGFIHVVADIRQRQKRNARLLWTVLGSVLGGLGLQIALRFVR